MSEASATADATPHAPPRRRDPVAVALFGWLVPGFGHFVAGRPLKGLFYLVLVGAVFGGGLLLSQGLCVSPEREPVWFVGQAFTGLAAGAVAWVTRDLLPTQRIATFDVGLLYTTVAGLLNLIAVSDALGLTDVRNRRWEAWRRDRAHDAAGAAGDELVPVGTTGPSSAPPGPADDAGPAPIAPWDVAQPSAEPPR